MKDADVQGDEMAYKRREQPVLARIDYRTELDLSGRNLSYLPNHHLASTYLALQTLDISNNSISRLEGLPQTLTTLDVSNNLLKIVSGLDESFSLTTLVLDNNSITSLDRGLENCTSLTELSVAQNGLRNLGGLECCLPLSRIDASHNHIASVDALRTLSLNAKLVWMALRGNPCASTVSFRLKLCGLLPHLLLLDNMKMPRSNYRPTSPRLSREPSHSTKVTASPGRAETPRRAVAESAQNDAMLGPWSASASRSAAAYDGNSYARRSHSPSPMRGRSPQCAAPTQSSLAREQEQQRRKATMLLVSSNREHGIGRKHETQHRTSRTTHISASSRSPPGAQRCLHPGAQPESVRDATPSPQDRSGDRSMEWRKRGAKSAKGVVKGLHEQTEKLYQCHVLEMGVITKQQQQINDLRRELKIVKSAVTYINSRMPTTPSKQPQLHKSSADCDDSTDRGLQEARETFEQLVAAREALVKAMHYADEAQKGAANREYEAFRAEVLEAGMISALPLPLSPRHDAAEFDGRERHSRTKPESVPSERHSSTKPQSTPKERRSSTYPRGARGAPSELHTSIKPDSTPKERINAPQPTPNSATKASLKLSEHGRSHGQTDHAVSNARDSQSREYEETLPAALELSESILLSLQDCVDEVSDEQTTVGLALRNVVKLARMEDCEPEKIDEYRRLLEDCGVLEEYELPHEIARMEGNQGDDEMPSNVHEVLASAAQLNTAKTALRKMMGLLANNTPGSAVVVRYAGVIESSLLVDQT